MKLKLLMVSAVLMSAAIGTLPVLAQTDNQPVPSDEQVRTTESPRGQEAARKQALQERLAARKQQVQERITAARTQRIQTNCRAAQGKVTSLEAKVQGTETSRQEVYTNLQRRLEALSQKLADEGIDTSALDVQRQTLQAEVDKFFATLATYKQAVADLAAMDCASDPEAFHATLVSVRTMLPELRQQAQTIRSILQDQIKPTLLTIKQQLQPAETTRTEGEQ